MVSKTIGRRPGNDFPVKESAHKKWGEDYATDKNKMLYCGPFVIDKWVPDSMFDAKQLDTMGVSGDFIFKYLEAGMLKQMPDDTTWYLQLNLKDPLFQNAKIRKAISLAFDRKTFCDNVLRNYSKIRNQLDASPSTVRTPP